MDTFRLISDNGSDRATGYNMSCKIIRSDEHLFLGWLDAPEHKGDSARIMVARCDPETGEPNFITQVGAGIDNHCGPALAYDPHRKRLHVITGAHHGPFEHFCTDDLGESWFLVEKIGEENSYPSLAIDGNGTLHLAYRKRSNRWQMCYRSKQVEHAWGEEIAVAVSPMPGYNHFMQSLSATPDGTLHLTFQFHYAESGRAQDCKGRAVLHVQSSNQGESWFSSKQAYDQPITIDSMDPVCAYPNENLRRHDLRIGNHIPPLPNGDGKLSSVCFFTTVPDNPHGQLWYQNQTCWESINLSKFTSGLNVHGGKSTSISRDIEGNVHLVIATSPVGQETAWFDPSHELFHLALNPTGELISFSQITDVEASSARWLPALEYRNWQSSKTGSSNGLWMMFTEGLNQGGIGGDNANAIKTKVYLAQLQVRI